MTTTTEPSSPANPDEYNGWTNRETWAAHLWLTNDQGLYNAVRASIIGAVEVHSEDFLRAFPPSVYPDMTPPAKSYAADAVKEFTEDWLDGQLDSSVTDEIRSAARDIGSLWRVDWREIAAALTEDQ